MIYRALGSTGEKVSAIGVGGWHLGLKQVDEQLALRIVRSAIDRGINFLDNSWDYNEGASEILTGLIGGIFPERVRQLGERTAPDTVGGSFYTFTVTAGFSTGCFRGASRDAKSVENCSNLRAVGEHGSGVGDR